MTSPSSPAAARSFTAEPSPDVAITGSGTIDGSGQNFWIWSDKAARRYPPGRLIYPRPTLVSLARMPAIAHRRDHPDQFAHVSPRPGHAFAGFIDRKHPRCGPERPPNTDAIDPGGERIIIRHCEIDTGDDNVAIQGGSHGVLIEDLTCLHGHGISIGSGTLGGLSHIFVRRCTFDGTENGLRIKSYRGRGGEVHDINYSDITMKNVTRPFDINMLYNGNANVKVDIGPRQANGLTRNDSLFPRYPLHQHYRDEITRSRQNNRPARAIGPRYYVHKRSDSGRPGGLVQDAKNVVFNNVQLKIAVGDSITKDNGIVDIISPH